MLCNPRLDPRGAPPEAFTGADRGRWLRTGATRTPNARQPKLHGPGAPAARHRGLLAAGRTGGANRPGVPRPLKRWKGFLADEDGSPKGQSTGGRAEQASNTARGTPEKWRTCGTTKPSGASSKSIAQLQLRERLRPAGPSGPRRPAPPSLLERRSYPKPGRENAPREGGRLCGIWRWCNARTANSSFPLPASAGRGC